MDKGFSLKNLQFHGIRAGVVRIIAIVRRDPSSVAATTPRANNRGNRPPALFIIPFLGAFVSLGGFDPAGYHAFVYPFEGSVEIGPEGSG